jgi:hypothetical protein
MVFSLWKKTSEAASEVTSAQGRLIRFWLTIYRRLKSFIFQKVEINLIVGDGEEKRLASLCLKAKMK